MFLQQFESNSEKRLDRYTSPFIALNKHQRAKRLRVLGNYVIPLRYSRARKLDDEARALEINKYHVGRIRKEMRVYIFSWKSAVVVARRSSKSAFAVFFSFTVPLSTLRLV